MEQSLKYHPNIERIGLANNFLSPIAAQALGNIIRAEARHPRTKAWYRTNKLRSLYLTLNRLGPAGAVELSNAIGQHQRIGGPAFMANEGLRELYLDSNVIGDIGAQAIAGMLHPTRGSLMQIVSLRSNRITDVGGQALLDAIQINNALLELHLDQNPISPGIISAIKAKLNANCCENLFSYVRYREEDVCVEQTMVPCPDKARADAHMIVDHYKYDGRCCERIAMNRCL